MGVILDMIKLYKLRFEDICIYEVKAETEEEAIAKSVPKTEHRTSITILNNSGYGKTYILNGKRN